MSGAIAAPPRPAMSTSRVVLLLAVYVVFAAALGQWDINAPVGYRYAIAAVLIAGLAWEGLRSEWVRKR